MRIFRHFAVITALAGLVAGSGAAAASASASARTGAAGTLPRPTAVRVVGGATVVTSAPGVAQTLLASGIVPLATAPAVQSAVVTPAGPAERFVFPVVGGTLDLRTLRGVVLHAGGVTFVNVRNGMRIDVSRFIVDLGRRVLTGLVNGKVRVPVFNLDLSRVRVTAGRNVILAKGIGLRLTAVAAAGLNQALRTSLFRAGLLFGTADSVLRVQGVFPRPGPCPRRFFCQRPGPGPMGSRR